MFGGTKMPYYDTPMQLYDYFQKQEPDVMLSSPDNGALSILSYLLTKGY